MKATTGMLVTVLLAAAAYGCVDRGAATTATVLWFTETEPGVDQALSTRMIVTGGHLRIDDGNDGNDFVLFDRKDGSIYSSSTDDKRILVIRRQAVTAAAPMALAYSEEVGDERFPPVGGQEVRHVRFFANGDLCFDVFAARTLLPDAAAALREYRQSLAGEQARALAIPSPIPPSACDLANNVFAPARHLTHGLPVRMRDMTGRTRELRDFKVDVPVNPAWMVLPADYRRFTLDDMRAG